MTEPFRVPIAVRGYELDTNGHLNQAVYLLYAEHSRRECMRAAGIAEEKLQAAGVGPVILETTIRFRRELRDGDEVDVSCELVWGEGKTFRISHEIRRVDGTVAAELDVLAGVLDRRTRRLVPDPAAVLRSLASAPEVLCGNQAPR
jgi:acyl-CoA thioester hydrolase